MIAFTFVETKKKTLKIHITFGSMSTNRGKDSCAHVLVLRGFTLINI